MTTCTCLFTAVRQSLKTTGLRTLRSCEAAVENRDARVKATARRAPCRTPAATHTSSKSLIASWCLGLRAAVASLLPAIALARARSSLLKGAWPLVAEVTTT